MKSSLLVAHVLGISLGFGVTLVMDVLIVRWFLDNRRISLENFKMVVQLARFVVFGLIILWISGLGYLFYYDVYDPEQLGNPKLYAKMYVVAVLSINGIFIHTYVLPILGRCRGGGFFAVTTPTQQRVVFAIGAISMVSWSTAFLFGAVRELNNSIGTLYLATVYMLIVTATLICAPFVTALFRNRARGRKNEKKVTLVGDETVMSS